MVVNCTEASAVLVADRSALYVMKMCRVKFLGKNSDFVKYFMFLCCIKPHGPAVRGVYCYSYQNLVIVKVQSFVIQSIMQKQVWV